MQFLKSLPIRHKALVFPHHFLFQTAARLFRDRRKTKIRFLLFATENCIHCIETCLLCGEGMSIQPPLNNIIILKVSKELEELPNLLWLKNCRRMGLVSLWSGLLSPPPHLWFPIGVWIVVFVYHEVSY